MTTNPSHGPLNDLFSALKAMRRWNCSSEEVVRFLRNEFPVGITAPSACDLIWIEQTDCIRHVALAIGNALTSYQDVRNAYALSDEQIIFQARQFAHNVADPHAFVHNIGGNVASALGLEVAELSGAHWLLAKALLRHALAHKSHDTAFVPHLASSAS